MEGKGGNFERHNELKKKWMQVKIEGLNVNEWQGRMTKSSQGRESNTIFALKLILIY